MKTKLCMKCKRECSENEILCECGSRYFISGNKISLDEKGVKCDCGSRKFRSTSFMDYTDKAVNGYTCIKCGNTVTTIQNRDKDDYIYWEDKK